MGKYYNRLKKPTKVNIPMLNNAPLKKKKTVKNTKLSHGYHKIQLLKRANSVAKSKCMLNDSHRTMENEVLSNLKANQKKSLKGSSFSDVSEPQYSKSELSLNIVGDKKKKSQYNNKIIGNSDDSVQIARNIDFIVEKIEDVSVIEKANRFSPMWGDDRTLEAKINAKRFRKRLMKHEKRITEKEKVKKVDGFVDLQHVSLNSQIDLCVINRSQVLLMMCHPCSLYFFGALNLKVIYGKLEVLGFILDHQTENMPVYSPVGTSRLRIATVENGVPGKLTKETLLNLGVSMENINEILVKLKNTNFAVAILEKNLSDLCSSAWPEFVEKFAKQKFLPVLKENSELFSIENSLQCKFKSEDDIKDKNFYIEHPEWEKIVQLIFKGRMRVALCGGKDSGKSTLMRYLINRSLSRFGSVLVIDCDPGQSEFVPPGCVSAVRVTSPLLGPHFTHLIQPERSVFVGEVDMNRNPYVYINSVETITNYCRDEEKYKNVPWIINTMGYAKGFGIVLNSSVLKQLAPSLVVQINCKDARRNFPTSLTPTYIERNLLSSIEYTSHHETLSYKLCVISSVVDFKPDNSLKKIRELKNYSPAVLRKIMVLTYFGKLLNKNVKTIFEVIPYMIDYTKINVEILNDSSQLNDQESKLDVINGSLVALCRKSLGDEDISKYECFGYGIVRAIDRENKRLFLTTPVGKNINHIDTLVKGSICLPESVYTQPPSTVEGHIPYTSVQISNPLHQVVRREFRPTKLSKSYVNST